MRGYAFRDGAARRAVCGTVLVLAFLFAGACVRPVHEAVPEVAQRAGRGAAQASRAPAERGGPAPARSTASAPPETAVRPAPSAEAREQAGVPAGPVPASPPPSVQEEGAAVAPAPGTPGGSAGPARTETAAPLAPATPGAAAAAMEPERPAEPAVPTPAKKTAAGEATRLRAKPRSEAAGRGPAGAGVVTPLPATAAFPQNGPLWTRGVEVLPYKVVFLGITMGYARFSFLGRVLLGTREAYHLRVRAWTSDLLSLIYPIDERIDYYLDIGTLLPLRQEFRSHGKKDDVAIYDQQQGTIVYRYIESGKVRKKVDVVPDVYDPVSLAYYIRTRNIGAEEERGLPMYAGRKVWDVTAKPLGYERVRLGTRQVETVVLEPVLRREGKLAKKSDMRMWITRDARHVPVRIYAKFRKFRTWTLVGELLPDGKGG